MSKLAERLIILGELGLGLLNRIYDQYSFRMDPQIFTPEVDKYARSLIKKLPEFPQDPKGDKGFELFKKNASQISSALSDYYLTLVDVLNFNEESFKLLNDVASSSQQFSLEFNLDITTYFMNLFTRYIQLQLLIVEMNSQEKEKERTVELMLASYAKAYQLTSGNTEGQFGRIAAYIKKYGDGKLKDCCIKKLQEEFTPMSLSIGNTLLGFSNVIHNWSSVKAIADVRIFNILDQNPTSPVGEKNYQELMILDRVKVWTVLGFLICPGELARPGAPELAVKCVKDSFAFHLHRAKYINIHDLYEDIFENYKNGKFKLAKEKKQLLKDAQTDWAVILESHHKLRQYYSTEFVNVIQFFNEFPDCIAPRIQFIFALLHLARDEIVWYIRHITLQPFRNSKKYQFIVDPNLPILMHQVDTIQEIVRKHSTLVKSYYLEFLSGLDYQRATEASQRFSKEIPSTGIVHELIEAIVSHLTNRSVDDNFEAIRLNWYRISAQLNHASAGIPAHSAAPLAAAMNPIVAHTRNIDCIETQLKAHGSFQALFYHRAELIDQLKSALNGKEGQQVAALVFVKLLNHGLHNVHRVCPEEQMQIGKEAVTLGDEFLRLIVSSMENLVQQIISESEFLRNKTSPSEVIKRMTTAEPEPLPGIESTYVNRRHLATLRVCRKALGDLCQSFQENDSITVYNLLFVPREYVVDSLNASLKSYLRQISLVSGMFQRPSVILSRFKDILACYQLIERGTNIQLSDIVRDIFFAEFNPTTDEVLLAQAGMVTLTSAAQTSAPVMAGTPEEKKEDAIQAARQIPLIHHIAQFYYNVFSRELTEVGVIYSPLRRCFLTLKEQPNGASLEFERYTDVNELRALSQLCGPNAFRVLDKVLLKIVANQMKFIHDIAAAHGNSLNALSSRYTESDVWNEHTAGHAIAKDLDALVHHTTIVGSVLHLREMLRQAQWDATYQRSPYIQKAVQLAHAQIHTRVVNDSSFASFDQLAYDCGIELNEADHELRKALGKFKTQASDMGLFALLPELYGLMYIGQRWRNAQYSVDHEGFMNNSHTCAIAIRFLIVAFNRIALKESANAAQIDIEKRIQSDFERFLRCSSYSILHMHNANMMSKNSSSSSNSQYNIHTSMIFLEQFIENSGGRLAHSILETCFPYTLLRTTFIQVYEKRVDIDLAAPIADDDKD